MKLNVSQKVLGDWEGDGVTSAGQKWCSFLIYIRGVNDVRPDASSRTVLNTPWFWKIFKTQRVFKNAGQLYLQLLVQNIETILSWHVNLRKNYLKPPLFVETSSVRYWWSNLNDSFRKRTIKSEVPIEAPQEISGFLKIPWGFRAQ